MQKSVACLLDPLERRDSRTGVVTLHNQSFATLTWGAPARIMVLEDLMQILKSLRRAQTQISCEKMWLEFLITTCIAIISCL